MQVPVEIAFHNMPSLPWAEEEIRKAKEESVGTR